MKEKKITEEEKIEKVVEEKGEKEAETAPEAEPEEQELRLEDKPSNLEEELKELRKKNEELEREISQRKAMSERLEREISEFSDIFPETALSEIPDDVWTEVKSGLPLSAAYARHERKRTMGERKIAQANTVARDLSSGPIKNGGGDYYYTPDEVRKMSAAEVKKNYSHIINSMKHWN